MPTPPLVSDVLTPELRLTLHDEVHARPARALELPVVVTHWVMWIGAHDADGADRARSRAHLADLLQGHDLPLPDEQAIFHRADLGEYSVRWELHTEFVAWTFFRPLTAADLAGFSGGEPPTASELTPTAWRQAVPGKMLAGAHLWALAGSNTNAKTLLPLLFERNPPTGSRVVSHSSHFYTDVHLRADGCTRMLVLAGAPDVATPNRLGRLVQRVFEVETYRMAALMGLPAARRVVRWLSDCESDLAQLAQAVGAAGHSDEPALLDRLTRLASQLEELYAGTHMRFSASAAYDGLMQQRLAEIAEERIEGMQTLRDFLERRLAPAMATCRSADRRQAALSARIARVGDLLRTRVEVAQQRSSRQLLAAMNRRQGLQLKLQSTVEGLSVAAITYYVVGLVGRVASGAEQIGWAVSPLIAMAVAVPVVAGAVWFSLRRLHRHIARADDDSDDD